MHYVDIEIPDGMPQYYDFTLGAGMQEPAGDQARRAFGLGARAGGAAAVAPGKRAAPSLRPARSRLSAGRAGAARLAEVRRAAGRPKTPAARRRAATPGE